AGAGADAARDGATTTGSDSREDSLARSGVFAFASGLGDSAAGGSTSATFFWVDAGSALAFGSGSADGSATGSNADAAGKSSSSSSPPATRAAAPATPNPPPRLVRSSSSSSSSGAIVMPAPAKLSAGLPI